MQPAASSTNNHPYLFADAIRAWAILLVVVLHLAAAPVTRFSLLDPQDWWIMNIFDSFARPAVALFIMISGLFLLDPRRREGLASFYRKRVSRIAWPFIGWAIVYLAWRMIYHGEAIAWTNLLRELVQGPVYVHFWFMYMLVGLYLVTPILRVVVRNAEQNVLWYSIALWFTFASVMPMVDRGAGTGLGVYMNVLGFAGYYMLGYMLRDIVLTSGQRVWMLLLLAVMTTVTAVGSFVLTASNNGVFDELFYRNASPNVVLMSVAMFLILKSIDYERLAERWKGACGVIRWLAGASFTIYFVHLIVLETLQDGITGLTLHGLSIHPLVGLPLSAVSIILVSALITVLLRNIPILRGMAP